MKLVIVDFNLTGLSGHMFELDKSLCAAAQSAGCEVTVLANRDVSPEVQSLLQVIPFCDYSTGMHFPTSGVQSILLGKATWEFNRDQHFRRLARELHKIEALLPLSSDMILFFPTIDEHQIFPIVRWAESLPAATCPAIALTFHFPIFWQYVTAEPKYHIYKHGFAYLDHSPVRQRFRLFVQSNSLAEEYRLFTRQSLNILPSIFCTSGQLREPQVPVHSPMTVTYLGDLRDNKGYDMLPYLATQLHSRVEQQQVKFEVQLNVSRASYQDTQVFVVASQLRTAGATLHDRTLSTEEYEQLLLRADLVVLPYSLDAYHTMMSGVFTEALAYGKPVIVPRGTWMARTLQRTGAGVTFIPDDRRSLLAATEEALRRLPELAPKAYRDGISWRRENSAQRYIEVVIQSFRGEE